MEEEPECTLGGVVGTAVDGLSLKAFGVMHEFFFDVPAGGVEFILLPDLGRAEVSILLFPWHRYAPFLL